MLRFIIGVFMVLHGLVHLLYAGHSWRLFELRPEMAWPDGSWAFSKLLGDSTTRTLASVLYVLATIGFVAGGVGVFARQEWWRVVVVGSAAFSTAIILLFWDGRMQAVTDKGLIAVLINLAILVALLVLKWPSLGF
jgi:hypothetical protein